MVLRCPDKMPIALAADNREIVKTLYVQGFTPVTIQAKTGVNHRTVQTWSKRYNWRVLRAKVRGDLDASAMEVAKSSLNEQSKRLKERLSGELNDQMSVLERYPIKSAKALANTRYGQGRAAVVKTIVESASTIYGWSADNKHTLVQVNVLNQVDLDATDATEPEPVKPVIEVAGQ